MMKRELRESQGVYAVHVIENEVNYVYIGSGKIGDRLSGNISKLKRNVHANKQLQTIYNKIGECKIEVLDYAEDEIEARGLENDYIDYYRKIEGAVVLNKAKAVVIFKSYKKILNVESVKEIKKLLQEGKLKQSVIAEMFNVKQCQISKIKTGLRWDSVAI
ncbi:hypothetical protein [Clostridium tagluense]|uniref:hypothetical protein n=1 Tax=Clostridium tagluense TaxID=360422 RepID=UPI001C6EA9C1|nr:hypothetical protein [Clostridium tagluense]MBW9154875.1 hypothetical protein [Clostridium tagluense]WLC64330.1 hypothetical protein KTC93_15830 [Clostridium tagluense]